MVFSSLSNEELVRHCAESPDAAGWEEFLRRYRKLMATVIMRIADRCGEKRAAVIDELVQDTFLKLCRDNGRTLKTFRSQHENSIFAFLKVTAAHTAIDYFRRHGPSPEAPMPEDEETGVQAEDYAVAEPQAGESERRVLLRQIDEALGRVTNNQYAERDRTMFWLYFRQGLTASEIAEIPALGLGVKGVESTLLRLTHAIREEMEGTSHFSRKKKAAGAGGKKPS